jgi:hypothetical protein
MEQELSRDDQADRARRGGGGEDGGRGLEAQVVAALEGRRGVSGQRKSFLPKDTGLLPRPDGEGTEPPREYNGKGFCHG